MPGTDLCPFCLQIHVKTLTPNVTVFGDRAFRRQLRLWGHKGSVWEHRCSYENEEETFLFFSLLKSIRKGNHVRTQQEGDHRQAMKKVLTKNQSCWYPDLWFLASRTVRNKCLLLKSPVPQRLPASVKPVMTGCFPSSRLTKYSLPSAIVSLSCVVLTLTPKTVEDRASTTVKNKAILFIYLHSATLHCL